MRRRHGRPPAGTRARVAVASAFWIASVFGASSPTTTCRTVMTANAIAPAARAPGRLPGTDPLEGRLEDAGDGRLAQPAEAEGRDRDPELARGQVSVDLVGLTRRQGRRAGAVGGQGLEAHDTGPGQRELGGDGRIRSPGSGRRPRAGRRWCRSWVFNSPSGVGQGSRVGEQRAVPCGQPQPAAPTSGSPAGAWSVARGHLGLSGRQPVGSGRHGPRLRRGGPVGRSRWSRQPQPLQGEGVETVPRSPDAHRRAPWCTPTTAPKVDSTGRRNTRRRPQPTRARGRPVPLDWHRRRCVRQCRDGVLLGADAGRVAQPHQVAHPGGLSAAIFDWIEAFYNRTRRHSSLGMLSPVAFERSHNQITSAPDSHNPCPRTGGHIKWTDGRVRSTRGAPAPRAPRPASAAVSSTSSAAPERRSLLPRARGAAARRGGGRVGPQRRRQRR